MLAVCLLIPLLAQDPGDLSAVRRAEQVRAETVARVSGAVCAVMPMARASGGSGVIFDPLGFVLTNFHVLGGAARESARGAPLYAPMKIGLPDGRLYRAEVLGVDPGSDLAVLFLGERDDGRPWPFAHLGDSDQLLVGETVFAMGNPFMLATDFIPTVTWGIVSGTHRYQRGIGNRMLVYPDCIQIDAPINPGNSGGPLFNEMGEVVGINGRISVSDRGRVNVGVGFAISSNQIRNFLGDLLAGRHAEHGTLDMNAWFMDAPAEDRRGVFVQSVFEDSAVAGAGVGLGDEITRFNGTEVRSANQLATLVGVLPEGSWVSLGYRSRQTGGGYGAERIVHLQLSRLDTGSSRDPERIAAEEVRRIAARALSRGIGGGRSAGGASVHRVHDSGRRISVHRLGDRLSWSDGETRLVADGAGGFAVAGDRVRELSAEEAARLRRELGTNPFLWRGSDLRRLIGEATLAGGVLIHGRPAYRFALPGEGERELYFHDDGSPAGYRYRDPVRRALVEVRVGPVAGPDGARPLRLIADGQLELGWTLRPVLEPQPDPGLFARPGR